MYMYLLKGHVHTRFPVRKGHVISSTQSSYSYRGGDLASFPGSPSAFPSGGSKVIRGIIARKEGDPGNEARGDPGYPLWILKKI